ncbi:hypothetical protein SODALDRAFT_374612 [Sodiomyces alkalinus F11]|uniref:Uncharacterized protein n=1 Tax=Sodiomyces alkalinus (strain CBS 110278 / VKM F-3762 / F11) TaxID=1314773 RepID=A0A3N2Q6H1_SODAK|nr:hypothetical protein SODALDRAFT_374612 [Sodiomyces alkalinus F11]ROT42258.1 hypothetical protein SODALDRAFT_374612 [Sodiomyces alkalinus F11]
MVVHEDQSSLDDQAHNDQDDVLEGDRNHDRTEAGFLGDEDQGAQEMANFSGPIENGTISKRYGEIIHDQVEENSDSGSQGAVAQRSGSPIESLLSVPDDTPSIQGSVLSSPGSSALPCVPPRPGLGSPTPSLRPFDRRFQSRISSSSRAQSPRPSSPAFFSHSRNASMSSQFLFDREDTEAQSPPWEVVRWTKLNKINAQVFSEIGKRNFGTPTCLAVSTNIVFGTSKGIILIFDYNQTLRTILGPGTKAVESGPITAIAISADHTTIGGGHANGNIFTWETSRASRPFLQIPHLDASQMQNRTTDGHVPNVSITHLGFLGTRHTALVSGDDRGMAFSHLATRGTGALGRTVKTTRILGRYPDAPPPSGKPLKPSTVLAFAPLPLGNVERATDTMGLTAMLTPYLLVVVSTTPLAQTQHKSARPKEIAPHTAMTGCLAWFPAVKLKTPDPATGSDVTKVKLVYCWSNVLTVLDVDEVASERKDKPPSLNFKARSRWKCEEPIVAVQWLTRAVLCVLTISQRLIILEDGSMRMTDGIDLIHKHIYHVDLFSKQLHALVEQLDEDDTSMHGVVADAYYMSFKAYRSRIFLLGVNDISIGSLSNWADRLIALMENGDYVAAIQLATSYYTGDAERLTVGLPEDAALRHSMVHDKLLEIMSASLKYAFGQRQKKPAVADDNHMRELAETCFIGCQSAGDVDFLFDEMYEWFEDGGIEGIFLETLEPYILDKSITIVPPAVVKAMVTYYVSKDWESRLEEMIVHMETATLDLDQITTLCKQHRLYDALIYVWNQALDDYITPLIDLLSLLVPLVDNDDDMPSGNNEAYDADSTKMFPYLSYALTGRIYPTGEILEDEKASKAKAELYWFLFSGNSVTWPKARGRQFRTRPRGLTEPSFSYLRLILKYDAPSFLSALNEAFEDSFLNSAPENQAGSLAGDLPEEQIFGMTVDRQYVVSILLEIMNPADFAPEDTVYLDMFIARNLPKFPQYLLLPGSTLNRVLDGLCHCPGDDIADDAQLSAEYLLSVYQPPDMNSLLPMFRAAGFYRILKRQYKVDGQYGKLIQTYFEDPDDPHSVFECIADCLRPQSGLSQKQVHEVQQVIRRHARQLIGLDPADSARTLAQQTLELHGQVLDSAEDEPGLQFYYLQTLLEPATGETDGPLLRPDRDLIERYVRLMCKFDPNHVSDYIGAVQLSNLHLNLEALLPAMEETGVIDAAVVLMAREGQTTEAMDRLVRHLGTLESALQGLLSGAGDDGNEQQSAHLQDAAEELLGALRKYVHVGIWLCQGQTKSSRAVNGIRRGHVAKETTLSPDETLWLSLIGASVRTTRRLSATIDALGPFNVDMASEGLGLGLDTDRLVSLLRSLVQHTFTALLTTTASSASPQQSGRRLLTSASNNLSFLRILRAFLTQAAASSPNLADLRGVLASIFSAYAYEESILRLSNRLLERSLFVNVKQSVELRQRGWRPRGSTCEACGRRVWGPGVSGNVFDAWEDRQALEEERKIERKAQLASLAERDKGKAAQRHSDVAAADAKGKGKGKGMGMGMGMASDAVSEHAESKGQDAPGGGGGDPNGNGNGNGKGNGNGHGNDNDNDNDNSAMDLIAKKPREQPLGPLVVLACRHIYHQACLDALMSEQEARDAEDGHMRRVTTYSHGREYRCPIDG